jgi:hypothetical protein
MAMSALTPRPPQQDQCIQQVGALTLQHWKRVCCKRLVLVPVLLVLVLVLALVPVLVLVLALVPVLVLVPVLPVVSSVAWIQWRGYQT